MSILQFWSRSMRAWRKTWDKDLRTFWSRFYAYVDMVLIDHGVLRYIYPNRYRVSHKVERQNHPTPFGVAQAARRGIKTIVNLRGETELGSSRLSKEACERHGIKLVTLKTFSRKPPSKKLIRQAKQVFDEVEYPVLLHCKSGADRAGLMSALYLILHEGRPVSEAKKQLDLRYGHVRHAKTGILDTFLEAYEQANREKPMDFMTWVEEEYDPEALEKSFRSSRWANFLYDRLLRRE
jgi:protein tyrosine/serine phosphatase